VKCLTLGGVLAVAVAATAAAQSPVRTPEPTVFRSGASLVALNVTVTDREKHFVPGLTADDFAVFENGVRQDVRFFEATAAPLDLIVLIDTSSSMRHRMDTVHQAALGFLGRLRSGDRGAVVAFNDGVRVLQPLTGDCQALERAVRSTVGSGGTALNNALYISLKQFGRRALSEGDVRRQAIVVLSDGVDTASVISFDDVLDVARTTGVSVYPIALGPQPTDRQDPRAGDVSRSHFSMRQIAQETGAQAFFPASVAELAGIYAGIAEELSSQYSLAYTPIDTRPDDRLRRIAVRLTTRPDLKPRARTGYVAGTARTVADGDGFR
jgi:Ca-activated chloride channel family protein